MAAVGAQGDGGKAQQAEQDPENAHETRVSAQIGAKDLLALASDRLKHARYGVLGLERFYF
jgi:hypothetical protein